MLLLQEELELVCDGFVQQLDYPVLGLWWQIPHGYVLRLSGSISRFHPPVVHLPSFCGRHLGLLVSALLGSEWKRRTLRESLFPLVSDPPLLSLTTFAKVLVPIYGESDAPRCQGLRIAQLYSLV